jgi:hypothetical protein
MIEFFCAMQVVQIEVSATEAQRNLLERCVPTCAFETYRKTNVTQIHPHFRTLHETISPHHHMTTHRCVLFSCYVCLTLETKARCRTWEDRTTLRIRSYRSKEEDSDLCFVYDPLSPSPKYTNRSVSAVCVCVYACAIRIFVDVCRSSAKRWTNDGYVPGTAT